MHTSKVAFPRLLAELHGDFEDVRYEVVYDHENVDNYDGHQKDVCCDECIASIDDEKDEGNQSQDCGQYTKNGDWVESNAINCTELVAIVAHVPCREELFVRGGITRDSFGGRYQRSITRVAHDVDIRRSKRTFRTEVIVITMADGSLTRVLGFCRRETFKEDRKENAVV